MGLILIIFYKKNNIIASEIMLKDWARRRIESLGAMVSAITYGREIH
jgi:hypothetical protein